MLAAHVAHLFTRDPLVIFEDGIEVDDARCMDHFENIQSTNWRTMRWKLPSLEIGLHAEEQANRKSQSGANSESIVGATQQQSDLAGPGWRVEFRSLEVQLTDFENAAFSILVVLAARSLLAMGYNFYMPLSFVEENMKRAGSRDAVRKQKFWINKNTFNGRDAEQASSGILAPSSVINRRDLVELSMDQIINGGKVGENNFLGLIPSILNYLDALGCDALTKGRLMAYLTLLQKRASGEIPTAAQWIRNFVESHPDSSAQQKTLPSSVVDSLLQRCDDLGMGRVQCPELLGDVHIEKICVEDVKDLYLKSEFSSKVNSSSPDPYNKTLYPNLEATETVTSKSSSLCEEPYIPVSTCSSFGVSFDIDHPTRSVLVGSGPQKDTYLESNL